MPKTSREVSTTVKESTLAELAEAYPVEQGAQRILLPRLGFYSQDKTEEERVNGKKQIKIVAEAGTFFIERETNEENADGSKKWSHEEIGTEMEGIILFQRKQLKHYDGKTETFTSSPIYDTDDEVVPLFRDKSQIHRGTPAELKALPEFQKTEDGKTRSTLDDTRVLYVMIDDEVFQLNLRGSSMFSFRTYARKTLVPSVVTTFNSETREKGSNVWNMMTFTPKRKLSQTEAEDVLAKVREIKETIAAEKAQFAGSNNGISEDERRAAQEKANREFDGKD